MGLLTPKNMIRCRRCGALNNFGAWTCCECGVALNGV